MARPGVYDFPASESSTSDKQPAWHPDEQQRAVDNRRNYPNFTRNGRPPYPGPQPAPSRLPRSNRDGVVGVHCSPPTNLPRPPILIHQITFPSQTCPRQHLTTIKTQSSPLSFINFRQRLSWNTQSFSAHPAPSPSNNLSPGPTADLTGPIVSPNSQDQEQQQTQAGEPRPRRNARHSLGSRLSSVIHVLTKHTNNLSLNRSSDPPKPSSQIQENSIDRHTTHPTNHPHSTHNNTSCVPSSIIFSDPPSLAHFAILVKVLLLALTGTTTSTSSTSIDEEPEEEEEGPIRERNRAANRSKALANLEGSHSLSYPTESREKIGIEL
ncbi:hypothetical protein H4Q26_014461 [Puccinia striiformis f. sp. tritici PST-130]|nr:hypothetical protein H4Q26_014461 [Puccinia striiformis f. sp. tritici PST-130]